MKIAFIRPSMFGDKSKDAMTPLVFAIAKPMIPGDIEVEFYDERVEKIPRDLKCDIVLMTVETFSAKRAYLLANKYRKEGKIVIMGGFHPTMCPNEALEYSDSIIIGELENNFTQFLVDLKNDCLKKVYECDSLCNLSDIKYDYNVFKNKKYNPIGLIQFSRGCPNRCEFCSVHAFFKDSIRTKSIDTIIQEIKNINHKTLFFIDDNLFSDKQKARELFEKLIPIKKKWFCQISIDAAADKELLKLMRKAGCILVLIGFESLDIENLKQMKKGVNIKNNDYKKVIKNVYDAGIMIYATFVIGYDSDTKDTVKKLCEFSIENKFAIANFNPLMPMPGTKLYDRLKSEDKLIYEKWWLDDNYSYGDAMLKPANMTPKELLDGCKDARYFFNTYKNIFKRLFNKPNFSSFESFLFFILANFISRADIHKKQGKKLGGKI